MKPQEAQKQEGTISIPLAAEVHHGYCSASIDTISIFIRHVHQTQRALSLMGVHISDARSIHEGAQVFTLTSTGDHGQDTGHGVSVEEVVQRNLKSARSISRIQPPEISGNEAQPHSPTGCPTSTDELLVKKLRECLANGPVRVLLNGTATPWSENLARPEHNPPPPGARFVVVREVGRTTHLITEDKRRYHPHDSSEAAAVEPGSTVMVENCTTESMLFADTSALSVQGELELSSENDSDR